MFDLNFTLNNLLDLLLVSTQTEWLQADFQAPEPLQWKIRVESSLSSAIYFSNLLVFDAVLLSLELPDSTGLDTLQIYTVNITSLPIIVLTNDESIGRKSIKLGAQDYLLYEEISPRVLTRSVYYAIEKFRIKQEVNIKSDAINAASEGIALLDSHFKITYMNKSLKEMFAYSWLNNFLGNCLKNAFSGDLEKLEASGIHTNIFTSKYWEAEFVKSEQGNTILYQEISCSLIPNGVLCIIRDITQRKIIYNYLQSLANNLYAGILVEDNKQKIILANQTFCRMFRFSSLAESASLEFSHSHDLFNWISHLHCSPDQCFQRICDINQQRHTVLDEEILLQDGRFLERDYIPIYTEEGIFQGQIWIYWDISERKRMENSLRVSNEKLTIKNIELDRATRLKDEFLANMSHELRTPLNAILSNCEIMQEGIYGALTEKQVKSLKTIESQGKHLLSLINDVLDLAKIEAGKFELHLSPTSISLVVNHSLSFVRQEAVKKRIQLFSCIPPHIPMIMLDERKITQLLINLLNNGVKFTPPGGTITVSVATGEANQILLSVRDTGIGIAPEDWETIFQPFAQGNGKLNRTQEGTGLGLSVSRKIAELHGGSLTVWSELGKGSTFTTTLPMHTVVTEQGTEGIHREKLLDSNPPHLNYYCHTILVVDDNRVSVQPIIDYLNHYKLKVRHVSNGKAALEYLQSHCPELILMDIQMPEIDGLAVMKHIRSQPNYGSIPIIAITALAMPGDKERCLEAGASSYFAKPIRLKVLLEEIHRLLLCSNEHIS